MVDLRVDELPEPAAAVLRRRARADGRSPEQHLRQELLALARRRVPIDGVVEFRAERGVPEPSLAEPDAVALWSHYGLPAEAVAVFARRAEAAGLPLGEYVRQELIGVAGRSTVADALLEFAEVREQDPSLRMDMDAIAESIAYARGM
ncbi:hypothetical protein [Nocardia jiangsuensis]|uniref:Uncharacterized protein n=1 Tax=Nocardia jiangsuensis TaxID=1691563 RepID=A0ABV8DNG7_9NOCA